jgi:hypothetical protein
LYSELGGTRLAVKAPLPADVNVIGDFIPSLSMAFAVSGLDASTRLNPVTLINTSFVVPMKNNFVLINFGNT